MNRTMAAVVRECGRGGVVLRDIVPARPEKMLRFRKCGAWRLGRALHRAACSARPALHGGRGLEFRFCAGAIECPFEQRRLIAIFRHSIPVARTDHSIHRT